MEGFLGLLIIGGVIALIVYYVKNSREKKAEQEETALKTAEEEKERQLAILKEKWDARKQELVDNGLPIIEIETLNLTKNEVCHFIGDAYFCKVKKETVGYQGGSRGVSFRVMKGVSFRVGNFRGHYIKEDIVEKTNGSIYLTSKKIIFTATKNSAVIKYSDIVNLDSSDKMLQIQTEKKSYLFEIVDSFNFMIILEHIINKINDENT